MTKTTEELKREMYEWLESVKRLSDSQASAQAAESLESTLEEYLSRLHYDELTKSIRFDGECDRNKILLDGYHRQKDLTVQARAEADTLRNKLQAFEFANRSAAELLSEALREPSGLRKSVGSTSGQSSGDNFSNVACTCCASVLWHSSETPKPIPMIIRAEFDDRIRTTCTACKRSEDVFK